MCSIGGDEMLTRSERDFVCLFEKRQRDRVAACAAHNPGVMSQLDLARSYARDLFTSDVPSDPPAKSIDEYLRRTGC